MDCPSCKKPVNAPHCLPIKKELDHLKKMKAYVEQEAMLEARKLGIDKEERLTKKGDFYFNKKLDYAMYRCSFYECNSCLKPYFGGLIDCQAEMDFMDGGRRRWRDDLICRSC